MYERVLFAIAIVYLAKNCYSVGANDDREELRLGKGTKLFSLRVDFNKQCNKKAMTEPPDNSTTFFISKHVLSSWKAASMDSNPSCHAFLVF